MNSLLSSVVAGRLLRLVFLALTLGSLAAPTARAGLQMDMHLYGSYFCFPFLSTNSTPPSPANTAYFVWSPSSTINTGIHFQLNPDNSNAGSGSSVFSDYQSFIHEITNGNWTLLVTNAVSTNQYTFTVTVPATITSNLFAPVVITAPASGQINVAGTPTFTWTGPVGWQGTLSVNDDSIDNSGNNHYVTSANLNPDQTSWPSPVTLPDGTNNFSVNYTSNVTAIVTVSTPVDSLANPFPGFSSISTLETDANQNFTVGAFAELVANGGFETGDFTDWMVTGGGNSVDDGSNSGITPHSGNYEASFGAVGEIDTISQTLSTTPGASYLLSFWLNSPDGQTPNEFQVSWNGSVLFDETDLPELGWTNLQFVVTATGTSTVLQFGGQDDPSYLALDDVSVAPVSAGGHGHTLIAHYAFDNSGNLGRDSSGNGNDMSGPTVWGPTYQFDSDAKAGGAVQFFGTSCLYADGQTLTNLNAVLTGSFTFSAWVKTTMTTGLDYNNAFYGATIFWAYNDQGNTNDTIPLSITGSKAAFTTRGGDSGASDNLHSTTSVNDGTYHLITVTRDRSTGEKKMYVDGNLENSEFGTTNPLNGNNYNLTIGGSSYCTDGNCTNFYAYNGLLDDLQVYSGVLSDAEVASLHANPGSTIPNVIGGVIPIGHSIVARYDFEDPNSSGTDSSGQGNNSNCGGGNGTDLDTASPDAAVGSYSRDFLGDTFICFVPSADSFYHLATAFAGSFSVSAWVKTTQSFNNESAPADAGASLLYANGANTNSTLPLALTGGKVAIGVNDHNGLNTTLHSQTSVNDGQYHHIAVTRNLASGQLKVYVDGNLEGTATGPTDPLYVNSIIALGGYYNYYNGLLDDVQIYSGVLADADVASLHAHPGSIVPDVVGGAGGLVVHYDFDEGKVLAVDVSGNGNNMVHAGNFGGSGPAVSSDFKAGTGSVSFDGGSYLTASSNLLATLAGNFTVSLWLKTSQSFGNQGDLAWAGAGVIAADSPNGGAKDLIPVALTGGQVAFNVGHGNTDNTLNSSATVNDDNWHHVVVTRSQATGARQIYIDGNLDSSDVATTVLLNSPVLLTIGCKSDASNPDPASPDYNGSNGYEGLLDDIQIYNRVVSSGEVAFLHNNPGAVILTGGTATPDFNAALGTTGLNWSTSGNSTWTVETTNTYNGSPAAAQSGSVTGNQTSTLSVTVTGPGTLTFYWASQDDCNNFDYEFDLDGNYQNDIHCSQSWVQAGPYTIPAGQHTLSWTTYAYGDTNPAQAGFLDQVSFVTTPPSTNTAPVITVNPFSQTNYPGYSVALYAAATSNPTATWQWFKVGSGSITNATNNLYIPTNSGTAGVAGSYYAVASNIAGTTNTATATVTFMSAPLPPDWSRAFRSQLYNDSTDDTTNYNIACLVDSTGNLYTVGSIVGTNTFGADSLISINGKYESLFLKQTATGAPLWGRCMTNNGNGSSYAQSVVPAPGGGIYVAGVINGTNWLGTNRLVDIGGGSSYVARFDANGSNLWVRVISGTNYNFTTYHMLASDPDGNVTLSALIWGYTSFGTTNFFADGQRGVLVQYDANGNVRWLQLPSNWPNYLTYSAGRLYGTMGGGDNTYIGGVTNVSDRRQALFCLNATNGQGLWVQGVGAQKDQGPPVFGNDDALVAVSGTNVFIAGSAYGSNAVFGPFTVTFPANEGQYLARYDTNGNAQLATAWGSPYTWPWAIGADPSGNVYVGGDFDTYSRFGNNLIAAPFYDTIQFVNSIDNRIPGQGFLAKFDRYGNPLWARSAQSRSSYLNSRDLAVAADGVWSCGFFNQIADFGSNTISGTITVVGSPFGTIIYHPSGYLAKITDSAATALPVTLLNPQPNGANFQFSFLSQSGFSHSILYRTDLTAGAWQTNSTVSGDGTVQTISLPFSLFSPAKQGFIRVTTQ